MTGKSNKARVLMKNIILTSVVTLVVSYALIYNSVMAETKSTYIGMWVIDDGETIVKISSCKNSLCGRIVGFTDKDDGADDNVSNTEWAKIAKDIKEICSVDIVGGFTKKEGDWAAGWILDFEDEKKYSATLRMEGSDKMNVRAYVGSEIFGETLVWKRVDKIAVTCDELSQVKNIN
ncbi:MAG: DUF2147 domain-containing protein [Pseudomonadota bacterium]